MDHAYENGVYLHRQTYTVYTSISFNHYKLSSTNHEGLLFCDNKWYLNRQIDTVWLSIHEQSLCTDTDSPFHRTVMLGFRWRFYLTSVRCKRLLFAIKWPGQNIMYYVRDQQCTYKTGLRVIMLVSSKKLKLSAIETKDREVIMRVCRWKNR